MAQVVTQIVAQVVAQVVAQGQKAAPIRMMHRAAATAWKAVKADRQVIDIRGAHGHARAEKLQRLIRQRGQPATLDRN